MADDWDSAFGAFQQALIDLDGDGRPDVIVPTALPAGRSGRMSDAARRRAAGRAGAEGTDPNAPGASALDAAMFALGGPAGRVAGRAITAAPGAMAGLAGLVGLTAGSAEAGDPNLPDPVDMAPLYKQRETIEQRRQAAEAEMQRQQRTGRGPRFDAAKQSFDTASAEWAAINRQIETAERQNSPEYRLELTKKAVETQDELRRKRANTPFKDLYADIMPYVAPAAALTAGIAGAAIKAPYVRAHNREMADLSSRWEKAAAGRKPSPQLAREFQDEVAAIGKPGGTAAAVGTGAAIGELSQLGPLAIDYARATPGSDLHDATIKDMSDPYAVGGRILNGLLLGGIPAKIGASAVSARGQTYHPGFGAETRAIQPPSPGVGPGSPPGLPVSGPPGSLPAIPPPPAPRPSSPGSRPSSPPYSPDHAAVSREYIDDVLASGGGIPQPQTMTNALSGLFEQAGLALPSRAALSKRATATGPLLEAIASAPPEVQRNVLNAMLGPRGNLLGIPLAAGAGAAGAASSEPVNALLQYLQGGDRQY